MACPFQVNHHLEEPEGETETSQPPDKARFGVEVDQ